jgi:hypothetical protein
MFKEWLSIGALGGLTCLIVCQVFDSLQTYKGLEARSALRHAEAEVVNICRRRGLSTHRLHLIAETAPVPGQTRWQFKFGSTLQQTRMMIEVDGQGAAHEI